MIDLQQNDVNKIDRNNIVKVNAISCDCYKSDTLLKYV